MADQLELAPTEPTTDAPETPEPEGGYDIEALSDQVGARLFPDMEKEETVDPKAAVTEAIATPQSPAPVETPAVAPPVVDDPTVPKSWPKEMHPHWAKTPPEVKAYWQTREKQMLDGLDQYKGAAQYGKSIQDVVTPYAHLIPQGVNHQQAVSFLMEANRKLVTGTKESRQAEFNAMGQRLGLDVAGMTPAQPGQAPPPIDPRVQTIEQKLQQMEQTLTARQEADLNAARERAGKEVDAFASDPANAFFDEVHEDIIRFIQAGDALPDAYQKAVWVNPVTREKQMQARLQTETEKAKERARLDALPKAKAKSVNVRGRDTARTPTEPLGTMADTMKTTLANIKSRAVH